MRYIDVLIYIYIDILMKSSNDSQIFIKGEVKSLFTCPYVTQTFMTFFVVKNYTQMFKKYFSFIFYQNHCSVTTMFEKKKYQTPFFFFSPNRYFLAFCNLVTCYSASIVISLIYRFTVSSIILSRCG